LTISAYSAHELVAFTALDLSFNSRQLMTAEQFSCSSSDRCHNWWHARRCQKQRITLIVDKLL